MCPQARGLVPRPAKMPLELFRAIIDDVCDNRPLIKLYLSGEPLLHENLPAMIDYVGSRGCQSMIHTNAVGLTPELAEMILASPLTFLSFSFEGVTSEIYEQLRPPAKFEPVRANILHYLDRRRQRGSGPHTSIDVIRMRETEALLRPFIEEWIAAGVDDVHVAPYMTWHGLVADRRVDAPPAVPGFQPCEAPFRHGCILSDGTVVPCCLDVNGCLPLGTVAQRRFTTIWSSNAYRHLRLQMLTGMLSPDSICACCDNIIRPG
jgi:MoaA/NifB/PqqE/SkfB family radical SAM enzyme